MSEAKKNKRSWNNMKEKIERKVEDMKTSELLDELGIKVLSDDRICELELELSNRAPFKWIEQRIEGDEEIENDPKVGIIPKIERLKEEIGKLENKFKSHEHNNEGKTLIRI